MSKRNGSYKGCCMMCTSHLRGNGPAKYQPVQVLRKVGKVRRVARREVPADQRG